MPQVMYNRPWPSWITFVIIFSTTVVAIAFIATKGIRSTITVAVVSVTLLMLTVISILDPETTIETRRTMSDGTVVHVRRPIIGFKRCERVVGVTGNYEVRVDGYRYERAYFRI
ncbi:hypothetical protein BX600DRAFT_469065 [Xylariales sp. PMI_506]|nr:hypothetical protein BX600DRAFT_469065 [Xylariales sp. PMI_506]